MSVDSILGGLMIQKIESYIPADDWFEHPEEGEVLVSVFRVHRVRFDGEGDFHGKGILTEFGLVRVLIADMDIPYPEYRIDLIPEPSGGVRPNVQATGWRSTGDGVVLVLISPMLAQEGEEADPETAVYHRFALVRATMVSVLGRVVAWEKLSEFSVTLGDRKIHHVSGAIEYPAVFEPPDVTDSSLALTKGVLETIPTLEPAARNRVRLALRWYERALGDRPVFRPGVIPVDELINYWVALETLVSAEEKKVAGAVIGILAQLHDLTTQECGQTFPISGIYKKRNEVMHQGKSHEISKELAAFMSDVFLDILALHALDLRHSPRTRKYLDGSAYKFL